MFVYQSAHTNEREREEERENERERETDRQTERAKERKKHTWVDCLPVCAPLRPMQMVLAPVVALLSLGTAVVKGTAGREREGKGERGREEGEGGA